MKLHNEILTMNEIVRITNNHQNKIQIKKFQNF